MNRGPEVSQPQSRERVPRRSARSHACRKQGNVSPMYRRYHAPDRQFPRHRSWRAFDLSESAVKKIVRAFNLYGIDGLVAGKRTGRKPRISDTQKEEILEEFEDPGRAQRTFWTATAFHGHIAKKYQVDCSYNTVVRLLHEKGYVLKVPQPWPDRQDEELREKFRAHLRTLRKMKR